MKLLIPAIVTLISLPLCAQTTPIPVKPEPAPKAATPSSGTTKSPRTASRRVVLPPKNTRPTTTTRSGVRPTRVSTGSARRSPVDTTKSAAPQGLQDNITIQLKGVTGSGESIDLSLTGIGPIFQSDVFIGEEDTILTHSYSVTPSGDNYLVEFSIGTRIRVTTSSNGPTKSFQYRDNTISSKVLLKPGKPVTVSNNQGKILALTISQP